MRDRGRSFDDLGSQIGNTDHLARKQMIGSPGLNSLGVGGAFKPLEY
jgi:hypothetical protein